MDDPSRYEPVPQKEKKGGKALKSFGAYLKAVFKSIIESFQYNRMKLPALLLAIGGVLIGLTLTTHATTIKQLTFTYSTVVEDGGVLTKTTQLLPGMAYDYTGIVIFILMLLGILNIFIALNFSGKKNLGSVVSGIIVTVLMIGLTAAYAYALFYFKGAVETGVMVDGKNVQLTIAGNGYEKYFLPNYMKSLIIIGVADGLSLIACVFGLIHCDKKKFD